MDLMRGYELAPDDLSLEPGRYQFVRSSGLFQCPSCKNKWSSGHTWTQFDLCSQSVRLLGQKCNKCEQGPFVKPNPFNHQIWKKSCTAAIESK